MRNAQTLNSIVHFKTGVFIFAPRRWLTGRQSTLFDNRLTKYDTKPPDKWHCVARLKFIDCQNKFLPDYTTSQPSHRHDSASSLNMKHPDWTFNGLSKFLPSSNFCGTGMNTAVVTFRLCWGCWPCPFCSVVTLRFEYQYVTVCVVPAAARFKPWVCGRSLARMAGSNSARGMDDCLLWVLRVVR
jgi:hypothetical protein